MHVLLVHRDRTGADHAARFLDRLVPLLDVRVTVLDVSWRPHGGPSATARDLAEAFRARGAPTEVRAAEGPPGRSILARLEDGGVDLVVLGSDDPGLRSLLLGSMARRVVRQSPVPVLVVTEAPVTLRRILVCTSLGEAHRTLALDPAVAIAGATGAEVEVLHVMAHVPPVDGAVQGASPEPAEGEPPPGAVARDALDEVVDVFARRGIEAHGLLRHGLVVDEIVGEARRLPADLVVVGAHDDAGVVSRLLTDITDRVVEELARPVLVLPKPPTSLVRGAVP